MAAALSNPQKRYLRGLAHDLKPVIESIESQGKMTDEPSE